MAGLSDDDSGDEPAAQQPHQPAPPASASGQGAALTGAATAGAPHSRHHLTPARGVTAEGRVRASQSRPGNARGNALSTNAEASRWTLLAGHSWSDDGAAVSVRVPLAQLKAQQASPSVRASFEAHAFTLAAEAPDGQLHQLRVLQLPAGGVDPQARPARRDTRPSDCCSGVPPPPRGRRARRGRVPHAGEGPPACALDGAGDCGDPPQPAPCLRAQPRHSGARRRLTSPRQVTAYSWADETRGVRVWVRMPGVHLLPPAAVTVRFRELSFDVLVSGPSADYTFAVTELPMEVVVAECAW